MSEELKIPHTKAGFVARFYVDNGRNPTEQEIFDAGMKSGRDLCSKENWALEVNLDAANEHIAELKKIVSMSNINYDTLDSLYLAHDTAMKQMVEARVPECGDFGTIAQSIAYVFSQLNVEKHVDETSIDSFAAAMKQKMEESRNKGRSGWDNPDECSIDSLGLMLIESVYKGDPVDIANFCMMLWNRASEDTTSDVISYSANRYRP